jgi:hypothetical protein
MNSNDQETFETKQLSHVPLIQSFLDNKSPISSTRRIFMRGLTTLLALVTIPGLPAWQLEAELEDDFDDCEYVSPIEYLEVGECEEMLGGPAREPGWYLHPTCMIGCCKTEGPFPTRDAALEADSIRWKQIAENSKRRTKREEGGPEDVELF